MTQPVASSGSAGYAGSSGGNLPTGAGWSWAVVAVAQLMVVLDSTIVKHRVCRRRSRRWGSPTVTGSGLVTAYALAFGSLLLVGGRLGDMFQPQVGPHPRA